MKNIKLKVDEKYQPRFTAFPQVPNYLLRWTCWHHLHHQPFHRSHPGIPTRQVCALSRRAQKPELVRAEVTKQLASSVMEPCPSEWAAHVLSAPKQDRRVRICIDDRRLNSMILKDSYPIPRRDEHTEWLCSAKDVSTVDAYSGYWQASPKKEDRNKYAFVCHSQAFRSWRMPFGLASALATFQRALNLIWTRFKWRSCPVYIEDIIISSNYVEEHTRPVDEISTALEAADVTLTLEMCTFFCDFIEYLGHIVRHGSLEVDLINTWSLRDAKPPTNKRNCDHSLDCVMSTDDSLTAAPSQLILSTNF